MANKPGRPRVDPTDSSVVVSLVMPARAFDRYHQRAQAERLTVPEVLRRVLGAANKKTQTR